MSGTDHLRASDDDREHTAEIVRQAAAEGRMDLDELRDRLDQVFVARTYGELTRITRDLPARSDTTDGDTRSARSRDTSGVLEPGREQISAVFGDEKVKGNWLVPSHMRVRAIVGGVKLNFTEATIPHVVDIDVQVLVGKLTMIVPDDIAVVFDMGNAMLTTRTNKTHADPSPGTPVVRIRGQAALGEIEAKAPRRWFGWAR